MVFTSRNVEFSQKTMRIEPVKSWGQAPSRNVTLTNISLVLVLDLKNSMFVRKTQVERCLHPLFLIMKNYSVCCQNEMAKTPANHPKKPKTSSNVHVLLGTTQLLPAAAISALGRWPSAPPAVARPRIRIRPKNYSLSVIFQIFNIYIYTYIHIYI